MNIVIAMDSFKGSLSSVSAARAVRQAAIKLNKNAKVSIYPLADGGEGTVEALAAGMVGQCTVLHCPG